MALAHRNILLMNTPYSVTNRDTADGTTTGYRLEGRGSIIGKWKIFVRSSAFRLSGDYPTPSPLGTDDYFRGIKAAMA
jgi:hypothetical protein